MRLIRDTRGQTMVFGAISLFILVSFVAMVANVGELVSHRTEMQNAADAAARSGALAEANLVSTVAFLNDGMAYLYYNALRYATNVVVFGTLAELKEDPANPPDSVVGVANPVQRYDEAYREAEEWIPRCYEWMNVIGRMERAMALSGEYLVRREIRRSAVANASHIVGQGEKGVEAVALFPDFTFRPHYGGYLRLDIDQIDPNNGWHITSNTGYMIEIRRMGPYDWQITSTDGVQINIKRVAMNHYILTTGSQKLEIQRPTADHVIARVTGPDPTHIDCRYLDGVGWAIHAVSEDIEVSYRPFEHGGFLLVCNPGGSVGVRRGPDGKLQQWNDATQQWEPVPGDRDEVTIGGKTIPIQHSNQIALPNNTTLSLPNEIRIGPIRFTIPDSVQIGNTGILLRDDSVRITARVGPVTFVVDDLGDQPHLDVNGLTTQDADGRWRILSHRGTRHRLRWPDPSDNYWIYEYVSNASYLFDDSIQRLAHHAIYDNDPSVPPGGKDPPAWTEWYNPASGNLVSLSAYHQTRDLDGDPLTPGDTIRATAGDMVRRDDGRYVSLDLNAFPRPLRLTDDFLKFGINVGVWRDKDSPLLEGGKRGILRFNLFENPSWGYFAIASARCAFLDGPASARRWRTTFDTREQIDEWVATSYQNLYEPVWTAKLVAVRKAILDDHIDAVPPDTGTSFMLRGLVSGHYTWMGRTRGGATWHDPDPPEEWPQFRRPMDEIPAKFRNIRNREGKRLDYLSPQMEDALDH